MRRWKHRLFTVVALLAVWLVVPLLAATLIDDPFTGSNGTLTGHSPNTTNVPASTWTNDGTGTFNILSNQAKQTASDGIALGLIESNQANAVVSADIVVVGSTVWSSGVVVRATDASNHWYVRMQCIVAVCTFDLAKVNAGSPSLEDTETLTNPDGFTVTMTVTTNNNDISATLSGGFASSLSVTDAFNNSATKHGMRSVYDTAGSAVVPHAFDNFVVTGALPPGGTSCGRMSLLGVGCH